MGFSRERERAIQGMQIRSDHATAASRGGPRWTSEEQHIVVATAAHETGIPHATDRSTNVMFRTSNSFREVGRQVAESLTLNRTHSIALGLVCDQLDLVRRDESRTPQLCLFVEGEGGTRKSRVIAAVAELFARTAQNHRLLLTATVGHGGREYRRHHHPFRLQVFRGHVHEIRLRREPGRLHVVRLSSSAHRRQDEDGLAGEVCTDHGRGQHAGCADDYAVNEQLYRLGSPIKTLAASHWPSSLATSGSSVPCKKIDCPPELGWEGDQGFGLEQRRQDDMSPPLWRKFTAVVMLNEQVRGY